MMRASDVSPRMFDNDILDFFSRTHWLTVPAIWIPVPIALVVVATMQGVPLGLSLAMVLAGFVVWSFTEYGLHRTAFHWEPATSWGPRFHFMVHGVHHVYHQDPYRLVMPPLVSLLVGGTFFTLFWGLAQLGALVGIAPGWHMGLFAGFALGYCNYDCTHYMLHHFKPRSRWMKQLRAHHMNHHHNHPDRKFGVSMMFWDRVFGTL
ncbi:MAG: sterol desaturase family protein [Alphaproteobacteria bacterium]|nr:sterol desaturase family protein [Alphaproteobacteria bacterium]